jgi:NADH dehydrogenase FAD-containing subunit
MKQGQREILRREVWIIAQRIPQKIIDGSQCFDTSETGSSIVNPVRRLLRKAAFFEGQVQEVDLKRKRVVVAHGLDGHSHVIEFDQIVLSLGSTTQFFGLPGE